MKLLRNLVWLLLCLVALPWLMGLVALQRHSETKAGQKHWGSWLQYLWCCVWIELKEGQQP